MIKLETLQLLARCEPEKFSVDPPRAPEYFVVYRNGVGDRSWQITEGGIRVTQDDIDLILAEMGEGWEYELRRNGSTQDWWWVLWKIGFHYPYFVHSTDPYKTKLLAAESALDCAAKEQYRVITNQK